ncbi:MAG: dihydrolipoyl dehydrogenase [Lachnospiraceae bacterium]|jgi:dihydrolipoamide dehydrogenase|nr:dihydrolipoyl dehydrogenase [Lachnospiraceae bacterium]
MDEFDLIVIGAGPGGYTAALRAAENGLNVAIIEKRQIGGTCINFGCIPTKALIHASRIYNITTKSNHYGVVAKDISLDKDLVMEFKDGIIESSRDEIYQELLKNGVTIIMGTATIFPYLQVQVITNDGKELDLSAKDIIIATGARTIMPKIPGIDLPGVLTSTQLLSEQQELLTDLVVIGGGVVGIECAYFMRKFHQNITIIEMNNRLLPPMDPEISKEIYNYAVKDGMEIHLNSVVDKIEQVEDGKLLCTYRNLETQEINTVIASHVLVAIGRAPCIDNLFALNCHVEMINGRIKVNKSFKTSIDHVYAVGDVSSDIQLAHVAAAQGHVVVEQILKKAERTVMLSTVPSCLFIELPIVPSCIYLSPEIATVGLSEAEAREKGLQVRCGKYSIKANLKAMIDSDAYGYIKVVFEERSDVLIGAQMVCPRATDMIGEMATAIANGLTSRQLLYAMRAHPTYNEAIAMAVENSRK